ncbi:hypothetical protein MAPG_11905 [Magnaporthiopsis poae ATCC 64411]|uniref:Non-reducing end beta-L-arabinofuranosidase-like GH127 middle domain-containing protein n=1 Tax=Magnaporthiopsis poae (strain ATCC 64411 / 73-15) TaxID=644358 RepID=A0A0C4EGG5_MAGP6|nr:hypothetical protein MAPG_11905 [Magnaporthiopsis poae ATCC 64411]
MDSIYFRGKGDDTLYVNLFIGSSVKWTQKGGVVVTQTTTFPESDTTTLDISGAGGGKWTLAVRVPSWVAGKAVITVNGQAVAQGVSTAPGTYASITRDWSAGDKVVVRLPMKLYTIAANDDKGLVALAYGPAVLSGNYGNTALNSIPNLDLASVKKTGNLAFQATSDGKTVQLGPFYNAHGFNYNVYWRAKGSLPSS